MAPSLNKDAREFAVLERYVRRLLHDSDAMYQTWLDAAHAALPADGDGVVERLRSGVHAPAEWDVGGDTFPDIASAERRMNEGADYIEALTARLAEATAAREEVERELAVKDRMWLYECDKHSEWLEKEMAASLRAAKAEARAEAAEQALAEMREALEPFARCGETVDLVIPEAPDDSYAPPAMNLPTIGDFRAARTLLQRTP